LAEDVQQALRDLKVRQVELELENAQLRLVHDAADLGTWRHDIATGVIHLDGHARTHFDFDTPDVSLADVMARVHPDDMARLEEEMAATIDPAGDGRYATQYRVAGPGGAWRWLAVQARAYFEGEGAARRAIVAVGTSRDITEQKQAEEALRRYELLAGHSRDIILFMRRDDGRLLEANAAATKAYGYSREELLGLSIQDLRAPDTQALTADQMAVADSRGILFETVHRRKDGSTFPVEVSSQGATIGDTRTLISVIRDITERKGAEQALRESEERYRNLFNTMSEGFGLHELICDAQGRPCDYRFLQVNPAFEALTGLRAADVVGRTVLDVLPVTEPIWIERFGRVALTGESDRFESYSQALERWYEVRASCTQPGRFAVVFMDVTERKRTEEALRESQADLNRAQAVAHTGSWRLDVRKNELRWSDETHRMFGIPPGTLMTYEAFLAAVHPDDRDFVDRSWAAALRGEPYDIEHRILVGDQVKWVRERAELEFDAQGVLLGGFGTVQDVTERKQAELRLAEQAEELARSNKELEQFAYIASHDLQEPLRMVASYVQLLADRYRGRLDDRADHYIHYAVDGAVRMKRLIDALLSYSRVGTPGNPPAPADSQAILQEVLRHLQGTIEEKQAVVTHDALPTVPADAVQLGQLFQNLIANALKFTGEAPPRIHIAAQREHRAWRFSISDNGIGLDPEHAGRIFEIFQRLHGPAEYPGTGIGLAICKKIVERHGGRIWVESQPGRGATFYFTIPA
jgi:PAS domain S-box-containing protein